MTYAEWGADERLPADAAVFRELETEFLEANPWLLRRFDFTKFRGQKVLEIGCGSGAAACLFAKAGAEVTAVDLANVAVELTSKNAAAKTSR
jgi:methylase of polypeptide subunit release factors